MTMLANNQNLTHGAQPQGTLAPPRFQTDRPFSPAGGNLYTGGSVGSGSVNTAPVAKSPTTPAPGQPAYAIQPSPNMGGNTSAGGNYGDAAPAALTQWEGSGGFTYVLQSDSAIIITAPASSAGKVLRVGMPAYTAVAQEYLRLFPNGPQVANMRGWAAVSAQRQTTQLAPAPKQEVPADVAAGAGALVPQANTFTIWQRFIALFGFGPAAQKPDFAPAASGGPGKGKIAMVVGGSAILIGAVAAGVWWALKKRK